MQKNGIRSKSVRFNPNTEELQDIISKYSIGESSEKIAKIYKVTAKTILNKLRKNDVIIRDRNSK